MFCKNCGTTLPEGVKFCATCGTAVNEVPVARGESAEPDILYSHSAQPAYNSEQTNKTVQLDTAYSQPVQPVYKPAPTYAGAGYGQNNIEGYRTLGGFLKFLVVMYKYVSPILLAISFIVSSISYISSISMLSRWASFGGSAVTGAIAKIVLLWIVSAVAVVGGSIVCVIFGKKMENRDEGFLKLYQITYIIVTVLLLIYAIATNTNATAIKTIFTMLWYLLIQVGGFFAWNTYFIKSVRVRVYMGSDKYLRNSVFNKNTRSPIDYTPGRQ